MSNNEHLKKAAAIVLGGGLKKVKVQEQTWYEPEEQAKARLDKAYALFEEGKVDYIITTGKYSIMARIDPGVVGPKTEAEVGKKYLITSDYHMERARIIFEWVLGPQYTVVCAEAPSQLSAGERERRNQFERALTDYVNTHLVGSIAAGDDEAIKRFMENEHQRMFSGIGPVFPRPV